MNASAFGRSHSTRVEGGIQNRPLFQPKLPPKVNREIVIHNGVVKSKRSRKLQISNYQNLATEPNQMPQTAMEEDQIFA